MTRSTQADAAKAAVDPEVPEPTEPTETARADGGFVTAAQLTTLMASMAETIATAVAKALPAQASRAIGAELLLAQAAPKDESPTVVLRNGREVLEVPENSAHVLTGMGWERIDRGTPDAKPGSVRLSHASDPKNVISVPAGQLASFESLGWKLV